MTSSRWITIIPVAAMLSPAYAADPDSAAISPKAQTFFERALSLDIGAGGAPDAVQAFAEMRRAAEAGDPQAAFDVAIMLDSGRGVSRDIFKAAIWYARAAARGVRRGAFNLGQLYEAGDGVPANVDLARAWYAASNLPAARDRMSGLNAKVGRPNHLQPPKPLFPVSVGLKDVDDQQVDLVWTSPLEPEPVRFFVEVRRLDAHASAETWSGFVDVSSVRLPLPVGVGMMAWRVSAVAKSPADYAYSGWSIFTVPQVASPDVADNRSAGIFETGAIAPRAAGHEPIASKPAKLPDVSPSPANSEKPPPTVASDVPIATPSPAAAADTSPSKPAASSPSPDASQAKVAAVAPPESESRQAGRTEAITSQPQPPATPTREASQPQVAEVTPPDSGSGSASRTDANVAPPQLPGSPPSPDPHQEKVVIAASPDEATRQEGWRYFSTPSPDLSSVSPPVTSTVLIILAQPSVTRLADLNNKAVVIAGLTAISRAAVGAALSAAGAGSAKLEEGAKSDVDRLVDGKVSAAIIACVSSAKSQTFPEIAGFRLLRVAVPETRER